MLNLKLIKKDDLLGRFFFGISDKKKFRAYYSTLKILYPFLRSEEWLKNITGFYLNTNKGQNGIRISYFTTTPEEPKKAVEEFRKKHWTLRQIAKSEIPRPAQFYKLYGGKELPFRRFLTICTQIGLDIMQADLLHARCLLLTFRWQTFRARKSCKSHFLRTFRTQSPFYNSLTEKEQKQFWKHLAYWPDVRQVDWAHFLVNMVLGGDWVTPDDWKQFAKPQRPLSIELLNKGLEGMDFQIPNDFKR